MTSSGEWWATSPGNLDIYPKPLRISLRARMPGTHRFVRVEFSRFKAFNRFSLNLRNFNILVGPNNAGKSTILTAFRILSAALRRAVSRRDEIIRGPAGRVH